MIESNIYLEMILHTNLDLTGFGVVSPPESTFCLYFGVMRLQRIIVDEDAAAIMIGDSRYAGGCRLRITAPAGLICPAYQKSSPAGLLFLQYFLVQFCSCRYEVIYHEQVEPFFAILTVKGGKKHAA